MKHTGASAPQVGSRPWAAQALPSLRGALRQKVGLADAAQAYFSVALQSAFEAQPVVVQYPAAAPVGIWQWGEVQPAQSASAAQVAPRLLAMQRFVYSLALGPFAKPGSHTHAPPTTVAWSPQAIQPRIKGTSDGVAATTVMLRLSGAELAGQTHPPSEGSFTSPGPHTSSLW